MVNFMFGANAPKLTKLILEELKREREAQEGRRERMGGQDIGELTDEERERQEVIDRQLKQAKEREEAKAVKELHERRLAECHKILENLQQWGVILVFPHARTSYNDAFGDLLGEAGLTIHQTEKQVHVTEEIMEDILYFDEESDYNLVLSEETSKKSSMAMLMKRSSENLPNAQIDDVVAQMVYGNLRRPPGDENCPFRKLLKKDGGEFAGIWSPPNSLCKALALKWFFQALSGPFRLPEEAPVPAHLVMAYDAFKYKEVMELGTQYPNAVLKYGFFSSDLPGEGQLITKTVDKFEKKSTPPTYDEKIVIQLNRDQEWFDIFLELGPSYMSMDTVQGEEDAKIFFPSTYDIPEDIIMEIKKKPKKKGKSKLLAVVEAHEDEIRQIDKETATEMAEGEESRGGDDVERQITEEKTGDEEEEEGGEEGVDESDKATSPMAMDDGKHEETESVS